MNMIRMADAPLLFEIFRAIALFSGACGMALLMLADPLATWSGLGGELASTGRAAGILGSVGAGLGMFALRLGLLVHRGKVAFREAAAIVAADFAWVLGTVVLLIISRDTFSMGGHWMLIMAGLVVLMFGGTQAAALWRNRSCVTG